jgi:hypothetical protein
MESKMHANMQPTILLVGNDKALHYLLGRFVEESQCTLAVIPGIASAQEITDINPKSIIFLSRELLVAAQTLLTELTSIESSIIVCSAVADESIARELGADHCLLHPITYDSFQKALEITNTPGDA